MAAPRTQDAWRCSSIGYEAFAGCYSLVAITLPASLTSIGYEAFGGCSFLAAITRTKSIR